MADKPIKRGRTRGTNNAQAVVTFFAHRQGERITVGTVAAQTGLSIAQVRGAISYLRNKYSGFKENLVVIRPGNVWRYGDKPSTDRFMEAASTAVSYADKVRPVPATEPPATFLVQGTLQETDELLLKGASAGVEGVWLARRLY